MSFESDLYGILSGHSGLTALVPGDRIQPGYAAQGIDAPFVIYNRIFSEPVSGLDGFTSGLERVRVQVDCYAGTFDEAIAIAAQARAAIQAETGTRNIRGICMNEMDFYEEDTHLFRRMLEFALFHRTP